MGYTYFYPSRVCRAKAVESGADMVIDVNAVDPKRTFRVWIHAVRRLYDVWYYMVSVTVWRKHVAKTDTGEKQEMLVKHYVFYGREAEKRFKTLRKTLWWVIP